MRLTTFTVTLICQCCFFEGPASFFLAPFSLKRKARFHFWLLFLQDEKVPGKCSHFQVFAFSFSFFLSFSFCGCFLTCRVRLFKNVHARPRVCVCTYAPGVAGAVVGTSCEVNCVIFFPPFFLVVGCGGRLNALVERGAAILSCRLPATSASSPYSD